MEDPHDDRRPIRRLACFSIPADDPRLSGLASCMAANVSSGETGAGVLLVLIAVSARLWECIHVINVHQIHRLELLTRLPWLTGLIKNVEIEIYWADAGEEVYRLITPTLMHKGNCVGISRTNTLEIGRRSTIHWKKIIHRKLQTRAKTKNTHTRTIFETFGLLKARNPAKGQIAEAFLRF